jgi:hypothetical protein
MTDRDDLRVAKALQGAGFPADRATLIDYARSHDVEFKTLETLKTLPDRQYGNSDEVIAAVPQEPEGRHEPGGTDRR